MGDVQVTNRGDKQTMIEKMKRFEKRAMDCLAASPDEGSATADNTKADTSADNPNVVEVLAVEDSAPADNTKADKSADKAWAGGGTPPNVEEEDEDLCLSV